MRSESRFGQPTGMFIQRHIELVPHPERYRWARACGLKASVDINQRASDPNVRKIFRAMQRYGLIVADNGSDMYITGTYDIRWDNGILNPAFAALTASDFEVVQLGYNPPVGQGSFSTADFDG